ncbi:hypothetical protein F2S70_14405, partial [Pseudomonas syringae pv. actinidiae]|nr:hypothetical protein [Pseudomonas syringae pv. actinidiae]
MRLRAALEDAGIDAGADGGRAIEETRERYRLAAKATNDTIWDWDFAANHVLWNDALEEAYGHPLATLDTSGD